MIEDRMIDAEITAEADQIEFVGDLIQYIEIVDAFERKITNGGPLGICYWQPARRACGRPRLFFESDISGAQFSGCGTSALHNINAWRECAGLRI
jgi:hypothetical protein